jgi:[acyl-carrier-protein] S-malonyltransferase
MGKDLYDRYESVRDLYQQAEAVLGLPLSAVSFTGPEETLKQTLYTQPALYVHSYAAARLLEEKGVRADAAAGHSLGEFTALAYAGMLSFEDGLKLVRERAKLMQEAGTRQAGTMAAVIGLDPESVMSLCTEAQEKGVVQPANYNTPEQIVISGSVEGVQAAMKLAEERGAKRVIQLPVSGAFHSPLMAEALEGFGEQLRRTPFAKGRIPVYANVTAKPVGGIEENRSLLHHQLTHSVRWLETMQNMIHEGISCFIEVGSGKVLSGMMRRISRDVDISFCGTLEDLEKFGQA